MSDKKKINIDVLNIEPFKKFFRLICDNYDDMPDAFKREIGVDKTLDDFIKTYKPAPTPIKMTKELPNDEGYYYWCGEDKQDIEIVEVERSMISTLYADRGESGIWHIDELGGYWAKVDKDQFEFVD